MRSYQKAALIVVIGLAGLLLLLVSCQGTGGDDAARSIAPATNRPTAPTLTRFCFRLPLLLSLSHSNRYTILPTSTPTATSIPQPLRLFLPHQLHLLHPCRLLPLQPPRSPLLRLQLLLPYLQPLPSLPTNFILFKPFLPPKDRCYGDEEIHFEWQWFGPFDPTRQGFEVCVWREGEPQAGAHNAIEDNKNGRVKKALDQNIYSLDINISGTAGVKNRSGDYLWTVSLVEIEPAYKPLGIQAMPSRHLCFAAHSGESSGAEWWWKRGERRQRRWPINP